MKEFLLIIAILLYAQPVLPFCDSESGPATDTAIMQHADHSAGSTHDCCGDGPDTAIPHCVDMLACGAGVTALPAANTEHPTSPVGAGSRAWPDAAARLAASHSFPPFRPPIS